MEREEQKQLAKEWHEAFGTVQLKEHYDRYLHPDFTSDFFNGQRVSKSQYIEQDQQFASAFRNSNVTVTEQIAEDNRVVSLMTWRATQIADLPDLPATGKSFETKGVAIDYFKASKVVKHIPLFEQLK